jgi:cell wall-associated NlpC family hydrolase
MERINRQRTNPARAYALALVLALFCVAGSSAVTAGEPPHWVIQYRENLIATAESQLHVRELTGKNDGPEVVKYLKVTGLGEGYPWCAAFVSWVFAETGGTAPRSARVVDWFKANIVYKREWRKATILPEKGMVIGLYYTNLGRYGHIGIVAENLPGQLRNVITIEGNTNAAGSREGQGVYRKIRPWKTIAVMADYCLLSRQFEKVYHDKIMEGI